MDRARAQPSTGLGRESEREGSAPARRLPRTLLQELRREPVFRSLLLALVAARLRRPPAERCPVDIECHPELPYHRHMLWKAALYAGARLRPYQGGERVSVARPRLRLVWSDPATAALASAHLPPAAWHRAALNGGSRGVGKREVGRAFAEVFGYALAVDPTAHTGPCVAKSDRRNGAHDGRVIECPIAAADPDLAYQRLVDNRVDARTVLDYRVPLVGDEIPFVYVKHRPLRARFANANTSIEVASAQSVLTAGECQRLRAFRRAMGVDLGELDVLRDAADGRIYVVDVNQTVWGPPRPMRTADAVRAVRAYAAALARLATERAREPG